MKSNPFKRNNRKAVIVSSLLLMAMVINGCSMIKIGNSKSDSNTIAEPVEYVHERTYHSRKIKEIPDVSISEIYQEYPFLWNADEIQEFSKYVQRKYSATSLASYICRFGFTEELNQALTDFVNERNDTNYDSIPFERVKYFYAYLRGSYAYPRKYFAENYDSFVIVYLTVDETAHLGSLNNKLIYSYLIKKEIPVGQSISFEEQKEILGSSYNVYKYNADGSEKIKNRDGSESMLYHYGNRPDIEVYDEKTLMYVLMDYNSDLLHMCMGKELDSGIVINRRVLTEDPEAVEAYNKHLKQYFGENAPQIGEVFTREQYMAIYGEEPIDLPFVAANADSEAFESIAFDNQDKYVGFSTAYFDKDDILYESAFGYQDRENKKQATNETVYEWGSITKMTVWVSIMQLYEQGKIDLNEDIRTYLPEGFLTNLKYDDPITILNLMNHNAGWGESTWALQVDASDKVVPLGEALKQTEPLQLYHPGEVASYSNWGAALAGYIVECVSGMSYADYVHENIFKPLGMEHTSILPDHSDNAWVKEKREGLISYSFDGAGWVSKGPQLAYINLYPAGSATGTISDLCRFAQSFVSDDCPLFSKTETRDLLLSPSSYLGDTDIPVCYHGLWREDRLNAYLLGHNGGTNACSSYLFFDTDSEKGIVVMTASGNPEIATVKFGQRIGNGIAENTFPITQSGNYTGVYFGIRSIRHGIFRFMSILNIFPVIPLQNDDYTIGGLVYVKQISDKMMYLEKDNVRYPAYYYTLDDGTRIITLGSQSYASDNTLVASIVLLLLFVIITIIGIFMLLIKLIMLLCKKFKRYSGALWVTLSQVARPMCIFVPFLFLDAYAAQYGLTKGQGYIIFGCEAICFVLFATTIVFCFKGLFSRKEKAFPKARYVFSIIGNSISIAMMILLELVNIWNV